MHFTKKTSSQKRSDFVKKLQSKKLLRFPGAYNPLCAKLIAEIGFEGVYISGGVMSNDLGLPDIGLTTLEQVSYRSGQISKVTDIPTIVDADTGFNDCTETISVFEKKGLAGCHIEDQIAEKRCGHLDNKELISKEEIVKKIKH
jgi:methylisocitrate lyase